MAVLEKKIAELNNVVLAGGVDDVRPYMHKEAVYIVPLRVGGGSRLKILEAFSMEMPVVSTTIGAEGLNITNNEHILLADNPISIVEAISRVIQNNVEARKMAQKGQNLVIDHYQWHVLAERLDRNWQQTKSANPSKA
jgi:glycosyltransferase involved in cell wall biosynthesis